MNYSLHPLTQSWDVTMIIMLFVLLGVKALSLDVVNILIHFIFQIIVTARFACMIAITCPNLMIFISFERWQSDLSKHYLIVNFAAFDEQLQANGNDTYITYNGSMKYYLANVGIGFIINMFIRVYISS